ncbi:MAG: hypothetical protein DCF16_07515 [Alphaproteobacteria bacterium]|nr:MAG: hypothetical protein DCF16_07515 [Alphaproteobacteria bacterium]
MSAEAEIAAAEARHTSNIKVINQKHSTKIAQAEQNYQQAELSYNHTWLMVREREPSYARWWIYWPFMIALATLEVPVNQLAFQLYFGEGTFLSTFITFGIGVILVVFAHGIGVTMRRFRHNAEDTGGAVASISWIVFLSLWALIISYSLAVLRQSYLAFERAPDPTLTEMIQQGRQLDAAAAVLQQNFLRADLAIDGLIFLCINIAILTVGVLGSFWGHDPHPDYAAQDKRKKRAYKILQRRKADEGRDLAAEEAHFAATKAQINQRATRSAQVLRIAQRPSDRSS